MCGYQINDCHAHCNMLYSDVYRSNLTLSKQMVSMTELNCSQFFNKIINNIYYDNIMFEFRYFNVFDGMSFKQLYLFDFVPENHNLYMNSLLHQFQVNAGSDNYFILWKARFLLIIMKVRQLVKMH